MTTLTAPLTSVSTWNIDPVHSVAEFKVKHMMISNVKGQFTGVSGTLTFDGAGHSSVGGVVSVNNFQICPPAGGGALNGRSVRVDPSGLSRSSRSACNT